MELGVWCFCTGKELPLPKPEPPTAPKEGTTSDTYQKQLKEYHDDVQHYNKHLCQNDHAVGAINLLIELDQFKYIRDLTTSQEVWDKLKEKHANIHTGLAAFYMKMGILEKKYTDGEDLHAHFSHITMENQKLQEKALTMNSLLKSFSCHSPRIILPGVLSLLHLSKLPPTPTPQI